MSLNIYNWIFGLIALGIGFVNLFWGDDQGFGIFIILLSFIYFPATNRFINNLLKEWTGFSVTLITKILLGMFIIWASVGVGEFFDKAELMAKDLFPSSFE